MNMMLSMNMMAQTMHLTLSSIRFKLYDNLVIHPDIELLKFLITEDLEK